MGEAIACGLLQKNVYHPTQIWIKEPHSDRQTELKNRYGVTVTQETMPAEILLLAVKPQIFDQIRNQLAPASLMISIMAGISLGRLEAAFPHQPVVRAMPNTPAQVGAAMTAIAYGQQVDPTHRIISQRIFSAIGATIEVPESLLDAVTGLSGSGPGYVALIIEALADGGVLAGLPRAIAMELAIQTVLGTGKMLQETGMHPAQLKDQVTSPGGTTIAGIRQLEKSGMRSGIIEAVNAAAQRAKELGG